MTTRWAFVLAAGWLAAGVALADPSKIDRALGKEPVYQTKAPEYGLLTFGPEGKDRVWLVRDGDTLYVDRNGNGNLADPGKKVAARKSDRDAQGDGYSFEVGELTVGGRTHNGLSVFFSPTKGWAESELGKRSDVQAILAKNPNAMLVRIAIDVELPGMKGGGLDGRVSFMVGPVDLTGVFLLAHTPAEAPVVRLGGPLEINFYAERPTLRVGRSSDFVLAVGTPGVGPGTFSMIEYQDTIPESAKPVVELTLPAAKAGDPPIREKFEIKKRC